MSERENKGMVPMLRFPEFRRDEGWNKHILEEFLTESRIKGSKGDVARKITVKLWGKGVFEKNGEIRGSVNTQYYRRSAGQFIYSKLDFLNQAFGIIPPNLDNFESTVDLPCFDLAEGIDPIFLLEYVQHKEFYEKLGETADGSRKAKRIHADTFLSFPIFMPKIEEQQKIADCVSSLDDLIAAHTQKHEALKAHKKGLMQQLFPAEGETVPELRFPEFRDAGEWEEVRLEDIGEFTGGGTPSKSRSDYWNGDIPWVSSSDLIDDSIHQLKISRFITVEAIKTSATKLVPVNTILLVSRVGVGKLAITNKQVCTSQDFTNFTPTEDNLVFLAYYLKTRKSRFLSFNQGMAIKGFTKDDVATLNLRLPDFNEQQKIADCLSSIDDFISAQSEKIESLKDHKKGLMQQLFPVQAEQASESLPKAAQA